MRNGLNCNHEKWNWSTKILGKPLWITILYSCTVLIYILLLPNLSSWWRHYIARLGQTQRRSRRPWLIGACAVASFSSDVMVMAVIMLSFILSRTLCQTFAEASYKSCPTLVTTLRAFTTSGPKCGEDSSGGKIIMINVNIQVKSKVHQWLKSLKIFLAINLKRTLSQQKLSLMII